MRVFDCHGQRLREIDAGIWVGTRFYFRPQLAHKLGAQGIILAEPLRVQLELGETAVDGERILARIRRQCLVQGSLRAG